MDTQKEQAKVMAAANNNDTPMALRVKEMLLESFYQPVEVGEAMPKDVVMVQGLTAKVGLNPERLEQNRREFISILRLMAKPFFKTGADGIGGQSFIHLCTTDTGEQWGDHIACEALCILAFAYGVGKFPVPRPMWANLPGGMPYIQFDLGETQLPCDSEAGNIKLQAAFAIMVLAGFLFLCNIAWDWHLAHPHPRQHDNTQLEN